LGYVGFYMQNGDVKISFGDSVNSESQTAQGFSFDQKRIT